MGMLITLTQYIYIYIYSETCVCMQINGKHISWDHLIQLFKKTKSTSGLSLIPKLTREHIYLNSYSRMRVNLAAQVNSLKSYCS